MNEQFYLKYKERLNGKFSPNDPNNPFSSIQNQFEESKGSSFMNESFEQEERKFLYRSTSEILLRDGVDMYDIEDVVDFNQISIPMSKLALADAKSKPKALLEASKRNKKSNKRPPSNDS